ncbi:hypothetical protein HPB49_015249 [Dermacentor silvarum]|uniref:Uncharacterized protein n=1 Tax=Dermacentor silvarum TaxID=543639 RepID=A0ACB8DDZ9_DERSI|nr:hypothetical protein HPB49_015249 [Dermacentor silvarum]
MHGPIDAQVTKETIPLGSIFEDTCTSNAQCEPRGASCSEGRYLYKLSDPLCDYSEQCVFAQLNGVYTDHLIGDCALEFVRSLDGKTCDKLQTTAGNVLDSPARPTANATLPEPLASRTSLATPQTPSTHDALRLLHDSLPQRLRDSHQASGMVGSLQALPESCEVTRKNGQLTD